MWKIFPRMQENVILLNQVNNFSKKVFTLSSFVMKFIEIQTTVLKLKQDGYTRNQAFLDIC